MRHTIVLVQGDYGVPHKGRARAYDPASGQKQMQGYSAMAPIDRSWRLFWAGLGLGGAVLALRPGASPAQRVLAGAMTIYVGLKATSGAPRSGALGDCGCGCNGAPGGCGS